MKSWIVGLGCVLAVASASMTVSAQDAAPKSAVAATKGQMLYDANAIRVASVYKVADDGSVLIIIDGKLITVPATTLSSVDSKLTTSLTKNQVLVLH